MKTSYCLVVSFTGMVKTKKGENKLLLNVEKNDLLTFKTKREAKQYIAENRFWALIPAKIKESDNVWYSTDTFYQFI